MSRTHRRVLPLLLFVLGASVDYSNAAATPEGDWGEWAEARSLAQSNKWTEALVALDAHTSGQALEDASYYFNRGVALFQLGKVGAAYAHFEKASRLNSSDWNILSNLDASRREASRFLGGEDRLDPATDWIEELYTAIHQGPVRLGIGAIACLSVVLALLTYKNTRKMSLFLKKPLGWVSLFFILLSFGAGFIGRFTPLHPAAISTESQILRSGPGDRFLELRSLEAGVKLRLLGPKIADDAPQSALWYQVKFGPGNIGWAKASSLLLL